MRLISLRINGPAGPDNLLAGLYLALDPEIRGFDESISTLCLVGPNGSGKSQLLQTFAEIFQDAWHTTSPTHERNASDSHLSFELIYSMEDRLGHLTEVQLSRPEGHRRRASVLMRLRVGNAWEEVPSTTSRYGEHLPPVIIGYTSGGNETLSVPFFRSRAGYAADVRSAALDPVKRTGAVPDNKLLMVDYGTNLEVLVANMMLGAPESRERILRNIHLGQLVSWRCILQLRPSKMAKSKPVNGRVGVKLTEELERTLADLRACATTQHHDPGTDTYTLDFFVDDVTRSSFLRHWKEAADLYRSFHKLAMLNDLAIPKRARDRVTRQLSRGGFAARLPEPQDEDKIFRFEEVRFHSLSSDEPIDYVALSDGEHQQAQIFGVISMISDRNSLFLFDEPESHFNPQWRVKFISRLAELADPGTSSREMLMTSHAPFVPSDMRREQVLILKRSGDSISVVHPNNETFGASFDRILKDCFSIDPPISSLALDELKRLTEDAGAQEIVEALPHIGASVEKALLIDRLSQLAEGGV